MTFKELKSSLGVNKFAHKLTVNLVFFSVCAYKICSSRRIKFMNHRAQGEESIISTVKASIYNIYVGKITHREYQQPPTNPFSAPAVVEC